MEAEGDDDEAVEAAVEVELESLVAEMMDNLDQFVLEPAPQGALVKCRITRDRKGMDRGKLDPWWWDKDVHNKH